MEMYLLAIKQDEFQYINNNIIAKYLLAILYYKDFILDKITSNNWNTKYVTNKTTRFENFSKSKRNVIKNKESEVENLEDYDPEELYYLGLKYQYEMGMDKDKKKALEFYLRSAKRGNYYAQFQLGYCYQFGIGQLKM